MYDGETAKKFFDCILSRGNTLDPADGFRRFRGRDVDQHALLVKRGFA
jgi:peptidyl-dipeptidase Dcp